MRLLRLDGWANLLKGFGTKRDSTRSRNYQFTPSHDFMQLESMYATGGLAGRIVDIPVDDMMRQGFRVEGDKAQALADRMEELQALATLSWGAKMGRLFGGAVTVIITEGAKLENPVRETDRLGKIIALRTYDRHQITREFTSIETDPLSPTYGQPTLLRVTPYGTGVPFTVHVDRCLIWTGRKVSGRIKQYNDGWDYSVLDPLLNSLEDLEISMHSSAAIIQDFIQGVLSINGLTDMLAGGQEDAVRKRLEIMDLSRSVLNTTLLDADGETYTKVASSVAGLADLLDRHQGKLASETGIPITKLFGRSPGGLNTTGEGDLTNYYDDLAGIRQSSVTPNIEKFIKTLYREGGGTEPAAWSIKWNPLWQMSETEMAGVRKTVAETDKLYIEAGVYRASDVMAARMQEDGYKRDVAAISDDELDRILAGGQQ